MCSSAVEKLSLDSGAKGGVPRRSFSREFILVAFLIGLGLRLVGLTLPPFDNHATRQTQTLSTIQAFYVDGIDLLRPRVNYAGYPGLLVLELPVFQGFVALLFRAFGPHLEIIRILNLLMGAATILLLYRITVRLLDAPTAIVAALIYWLAPLNISYQRSMLIDPTAVCAAMLSFYSLLLFLPRAGDGGGTGNGWLWLSVFAAATWLTVMMKALYLWPVVLLFGYLVFLRRWRLDKKSAAVVITFIICGASFLAWNVYATRINNTSPMTTGLKPTSLLGFSALMEPQFYFNMIVRRPKLWLGILGALAYPIGLWAAWRGRHEKRWFPVLCLCILIPPSYLLLFANINRPHDYYQLIITPFLSIVSAHGLLWIASRFVRSFSRTEWENGSVAATSILLAITGAFFYLSWLHAPHVDQRIVNFQELCSGKFESQAPGMVFIGADKNLLPRPGSIPEYIYAAGLWGYGRIVEKSSDARSLFLEAMPGFERVDYLVFYGTDKPDWASQSGFRPVLVDDVSQMYAFKHVNSP